MKYEEWKRYAEEEGLLKPPTRPLREVVGSDLPAVPPHLREFKDELRNKKQERPPRLPGRDSS